MGSSWFARTNRAIADAVEIHIPTATFIVMFCAFVLQVVARYIFNYPLAWPFEVSLIAFIWTILLGSGYALRDHEHVTFGLFYDRSPSWFQRLSRIFSNTLVVVSLSLMVVPTFRLLLFLQTRKSVALRIPYSIAYSPFLLFLLVTIIRSIGNLWGDIRPHRESD